jgi:hypothetical protein
VRSIRRQRLTVSRRSSFGLTIFEFDQTGLFNHQQPQRRTGPFGALNVGNGRRLLLRRARACTADFQALAALFRGKFLAGLRQMLGAEELHLPDSELKTPGTRARWLSLLYIKRWVLYAKRPFGGPQQVLRYSKNRR